MTEKIPINKILQPIISFYDSLHISFGNETRNKIVQWMNYRSMNDY